MAMFDLAYARQQGGRFVLRIEDTDRARFSPTSERQLYERRTGWASPGTRARTSAAPYAPYRQSERLAIYRPYADRLLARARPTTAGARPSGSRRCARSSNARSSRRGTTASAWGSPGTNEQRMPGFSPDPVVRMPSPTTSSSSSTTSSCGRTRAPHPDDQVILKADGFPTYHLAVVVDDHEMGITHVARGQEWISSTPKHLLLYRWFGVGPPRFAHMPLLRDEKKAKISKRKNPWARLTWFKEQGYLPEALVNFLALQGYPPIVEADGRSARSSRSRSSPSGSAGRTSTGPGRSSTSTSSTGSTGVYIRGLRCATSRRGCAHLEATVCSRVRRRRGSSAG